MMYSLFIAVCSIVIVKMITLVTIL